MRLFVAIGLVFFSALVCRGQLMDDFLDGDFTSNPTWTPDNPANWTVVSNQLRSNSATASSTFYISTPSAQVLNAQWEFYVKLQLNTSSANFVDVYLASSNSTMTLANGYFVRIGGTPDEISLYKSTAGVNAILINGTDGVTNISNTILKIKVTRDCSNLWILQHDVSGTGNNYFTEETVIDNSFNTSSFFGIKITQSTSSFFNRHFFDNFYVGPIIPDVSPPILNSITVISSTELNLMFCKNLDPVSSQFASNYSVNNGIGNPVSAVLQPDQKIVKLTFAQPFGNGIQNQLTATAIKDVAGNATASTSLPFLYFFPVLESKGDIVISEIFPDPDPVIGMPAAEFIEIYNRSTNPFDLNGWKLSDGSSTATFSSKIILPHEYWIVTSSSNVALFSAYGNVIGVASFPSLNNSGDLLTLRGSSGLTIDSLNYISGWYRDADKQQGGWTLEKIDLNKSSTASFNWVASQDATGGTPGKQNSWFGLNPDTQPPKLLTIVVANDSNIDLEFDEELDPAAVVVSNFSVNNGIGSPSLQVLSSDGKTISLAFTGKFQNGAENIITVSNVKDIAGNIIASATSSFYYLIPIAPKAKDIIITEIFPDPDPVIGLPAAEFIEIYNQSTNPFDLNGWKLSDGSSTATFATQVILPQQYWIVTSSSNVALFAAYKNVMGVSGFPSLNNSGDLLTLKGSSGLTVDSLSYTTSSYRDSDKAQGGWTLEKIDLNKSSTASFNWVASQDPIGGTPGKQNSWFGLNPDSQSPKLLNIVVNSGFQIDLQFDEEIDPPTATVLNFNVNGIGNPSSLLVSKDGKTISLTFAGKFQNGAENIILISGIKDMAGNGMVFTTSSFYYVIPTTPKAKDIIISEIFPDPDPVIGLPAAEFVEIYNRSAIPYDLNGWKLSDGSSIAIVTSKILLPNKYLIVTSSSNLALFSAFSNVVGVPNFPSLNNSGDLLTLKSGSGLTVDSLNYSSTWYHDEDKANGGWSLELIDPENTCGEGNNWVASVDAKGGTPGKQNSVFANKPDLTGPKLLAIAATQPNQLLLAFDEKLEKPLGNVLFTITPTTPVSQFSFNNAALTEIKVELSQALTLRQLYNLQISNLRDCAGNFIQSNFNQLTFALPEAADSLDILVNEILFNPRPGGVDFVEVYNPSPKYINLKNFKMANFENGVIKNAKAILSDLILSPSSFIAFTSDTASLKTHYLMGASKNFYQIGLPSFNDDAGSVAMISDSGKVIDSFLYSDQYHSALLKDKEGVSLERISIAQNSNEPSNWKSASAAAGFATPGYLNSNSRPESFANENAIHVEPEIFSLQRPGQDFSKINYRFDQSGTVANVKILDQQGRLIKTIANNETLGFEGFFRWDGDRDDGSKARLGYYVVWVEVFDLTGMIKTFRERVVVAGD
jgi:Lamin Tail Domain/Bacterial Ig-like domain